MTLIDIPRVMNVVKRTWSKAEADLRHEISTISPGFDEPEITSRFHALLSEGLAVVSSRGDVERAFRSDVEALHPDSDPDWLRAFARGLIAEASVHPTETEAKTGGDLGVVLARPRVGRWGDPEIVRRSRRGLLCQAKLKRFVQSWGELTENQKRILPLRTDYLSLLLYRYDNDALTVLAPYLWQFCRNASIDEIARWLAVDQFPEPIGSPAMLDALAAGVIGSDDENTLDTIICPDKSRHLEIRIDWPPDGGPEATVRVRSKQQTRQLVQVRAR